ncbi:GNAT family N-acetyltransferase [Flavobacterium ovatum]|uniref:GNAT family N-acetyltransferase n=1 Tax=Flavobacterium ovatum TaxID=1928857 RepID=UPI00344D99DD
MNAKTEFLPNNKIEISAANPADFEIIQAIAKATWPEAYGAILSIEQMNYMLDLFYSVDKMKADSANGHYFALAKENETILGFVSFEHHYFNNQTTKIHKLYLLPVSQGKGVGKLLVDYVAKNAKDNESQSVCLNVNRFNKALGFYKKIGFSIVKEENIDIGQGYWMEDYVMEIRI